MTVVAEWLVARGGIATRADLLADVGVSRSWVLRQTRRGQLQEPFPGIVALGSAVLGEEQRMAAAVLFAGRDAAVTHESAAVLWQLCRRSRGPLVHVAVPKDRTRRAASGLVVHQRRSAAVAFRHGIPVVPPAEALRSMAVDWPLDDQRFAVMEAMRRELLRPADLLEGAPRRGLGVLRLLAEEAGAGAVSGGEARYWRALKDAGLPLPQLNVPVTAQGCQYLLDGLWREIGLGAEIDGRAVHALPAAFESDRVRQNHLHIRGIMLMRFTVRQVMGEPEEVVRQTAAAIATRVGDANPPLIKPRRRRPR